MTGSAVGCASPRASGVICTNATGKPINVSVYAYASAASLGYLYLYVSGVFATGGQVGPGTDSTVYGIIPPGAPYYLVLTGSAAIGGSGWTELR